MRRNTKAKVLLLAELHNAKIDAIKSGLSPIQWLKTTNVYVEYWNEKEWHIAEELEKNENKYFLIDCEWKFYERALELCRLFKKQGWFFSVNITNNVEQFEVKEITKEEFYNTIHF
jgi:hypothetical protein